MELEWNRDENKNKKIHYTRYIYVRIDRNIANDTRRQTFEPHLIWYLRQKPSQRDSKFNKFYHMW